jgi:polysaccharide export outer membrane protein
MSGDFTVDPEGMVDFPILGPIKASGFAPDEFQRKLTTLLADGYVRRPAVTVVISESQSQRVYVTGRVAKPGAYALANDQSLLGLVREIGTLGDDVAHEVVVVRPPSSFAVTEEAGEAGEGPQSEATAEPDAPGEAPRPVWYRIPNEQPGSAVFHVNLTELLSGNPSRNMLLLPGDTVFFPPAANVYVTGHVSRPGAQRFREGLTVFHAITLSGGLTDRGSKSVKIVRILGGEQVKIDAEMTDLVQPEDTIVVPERFF